MLNLFWLFVLDTKLLGKCLKLLGKWHKLLGKWHKCVGEMPQIQSEITPSCDGGGGGLRWVLHSFCMTLQMSARFKFDKFQIWLGVIFLIINQQIMSIKASVFETGGAGPRPGVEEEVGSVEAMVDLWPGLDEEVESGEERSKASNIALWRCSLNVFFFGFGLP